MILTEHNEEKPVEMIFFHVDLRSEQKRSRSRSAILPCGIKFHLNQSEQLLSCGIKIFHMNFIQSNRFLHYSERVLASRDYRLFQKIANKIGKKQSVSMVLPSLEYKVHYTMCSAILHVGLCCLLCCLHTHTGSKAL